MPSWMFLSKLLTVESTPMMQKIPMVTPKRERNVLSLFLASSCKASFKVVNKISKVLFMVQIYFIAGDFHAKKG